MEKQQAKPTTIREDAFDLLDTLCRMLGKERGVYIGKTDAVSIAVKEAVERRKESDIDRGEK